MANTIKLKRGTSTPTTSNISSGEVAIDTSAQKLYINDSGTVKEIGGGGSVGGASGIDFNDDVKVRFGTGNDLEIYHVGDENYIKTTNGNINIRYSGQNMIVAKAGDAVELYHNNAKKFHTISSGTVTTGHHYLLDSDKLKLGDSEDLQIYHDGTNNIIKAVNSNATYIDAQAAWLYLQSNAGIQLGDVGGNEVFLKATDNGAVELYYDNARKLRTTSTGIAVEDHLDMDDDHKLRIGSSADLQIFHSGVNSVIDNNTGGLYIRNNVAADVGGDIFIQAKSGENSAKFIHDGAVELYYDNSKKLFTTADGVQIIDDSSYQLELKRDGSAGQQAGIKFIDGGDATGRIIGYSGHVQIGVSPSSNSYEDAIMCNANGSVELYYDNSKKFETNSTGTKTTGGHIMTNGGTVTGGDLGFADSSKAKFGDSDDLQIYHDGSNSYVAETGTGDLVLQGGTVWIQHGNGENALKATEDAGVELRYNNVKKFETGSYGFGTDENIRLNADNGSIQFGAGQDLKIYHDGNNSKIINQTGNLTINAATSEVGVDIKPNGAVELYYDNSKKLYTESDGIAIDGSISVESNGYIRVRTTDDNSSTAIQLGNDGAASFNSNLTVGSAWADDTNQSIKITDGQLLTKANTGTDAAIVVHQGGNQSDNRRFKVTVDGSTYLSSDSAKLNLGASNDLQLFHDGSHSYILSDNGELKNRAAIWKVVNEANSEIQIKATENAAVELYYDNAVRLKTRSNGNELRGSIQYVEGLLRPWSATGVDLGTDADRFQDLYLHNDLDLKDDGVIKLGNGSDLQLYHNGTDSYIANTTGNLYVKSPGDIFLQPKSSEAGVYIRDDAAVELYYDNSKKFETRSAGTSTWGDAFIYGGEGVSASLYLKSDQGDDNGDGWRINSNQDDNDLTISNDITGSYVDKLTLQNDGDLFTTGDLYIQNDSKKLKLGSSNDMQLWHDGSHSHLQHENTGNLYVLCKSGQINFETASEVMAQMIPNGAVNLYYDNSKKLATDSVGTIFYDDIFVGDSYKVNLGASSDLQVYHDGSDSHIVNLTGDLRIECTGDDLNLKSNDDFSLKVQGGVESAIIATGNGAVELYYDNVKKLYTDTNGVRMDDSVWSYWGTDQDLYIGHNGYNAFIKNTTGDTNIQADALYLKNKDGDETYIKCANDNQVELYHNNVKRLETKSGGVQMHGDVWAWEIYNNTTSGGSNVRVQSSGLLQRDTSSRRYKNSITDAVHGLADLKKLRSVTFKGNNDGDTIFGGLIAEEVHDAGLTEFVDYNDDNQPEALCYGNMVSLCIKAIQELAAEVETLKTKVTALEAA